MNQEVTSILVLVAIFAIGTLRPINMGLLGITAAFVVGSAVGRLRGRHLRRLPGRPVHHPGRCHLPVRDREQQRHRRLAGSCRGARRRRARRADPVGDVRDHRGADRGRLGRPRGGGDRRADRARLRRPLQDQPGDDGPDGRQRRDRRRLLADQHLRLDRQRRGRAEQPRGQPDAAVLLLADLQHRAQRGRVLHVRRARPAAPPRRPRARGDRALQARDDREGPAGDRRRRGRDERRGARAGPRPHPHAGRHRRAGRDRARRSTGTSASSP